jgi:hypothetical protein
MYKIIKTPDLISFKMCFSFQGSQGHAKMIILHGTFFKKNNCVVKTSQMYKRELKVCLQSRGWNLTVTPLQIQENKMSPASFPRLLSFD